MLTAFKSTVNIACTDFCVVAMPSDSLNTQDKHVIHDIHDSNDTHGSHGSRDKDPQFAYTLARGLQVLRAFEGTRADLGNREIGEIIGIPRSTAARLTRTLSLLGYLQYDQPTQRYRLTAAMLTLAYPVLAQLPVRQMARPHMQELANHVKGSVSLAMRQGLTMVLIESCVDPKAVTRPDIGAVRELATTALGLAYLAGLSTDIRNELLAQLSRAADLSQSKGKTDTSSSLIMTAEFDRYANEGFCMAHSEPAGTVAVGVPLRLRAAGTLSLNCVIAKHLTTAKLIQNDVGPRLAKLARDLELLMGYPA